MISADLTYAGSECEQLLDLLSQFDSKSLVSGVLRDAGEVRRLLHRYSFRSPQRAELLCAQLTSRYREEFLSLYGPAALSLRQSSSVYLRLEQLLPLLARIAMLRLSRMGALPFSLTQLTLGDGMLLRLLKKEITGG